MGATPYIEEREAGDVENILLGMGECHGLRFRTVFTEVTFFSYQLFSPLRLHFNCLSFGMREWR